MFTLADIFDFRAIRLGNKFVKEFLAVELKGNVGWKLYLSPEDPYEVLDLLDCN